MASDITAPLAAAPQKVSRYRSVRRAQEQQAQQSQQQQPAPPLPPMPAMPEGYTSGGAQRDTPNSNIGRSMSRYHRRPPTAHATSPNAPPLRSNTTPQAPPLPQTTLPPSSSARHRAVSTPQQSLNSASNVQPRPRTARHGADAAPLSPTGARQAQEQYEDPRMLLQKERERQRLLKEKMEAEARAQKEAKIAEIERLEKLRLEADEAARLEAERVAEAAEALRLQREEEKAEKERGKKLRKVEAQKAIEQRKAEERRAKLEKENRARLEEKSRTFLSQSSGSPPVSPPRQEGFGLFKRRKDEGLSLSSEERPPTGKPQTARQNSFNDQSDPRPRTSRQPSSSNQPDAILSGGGGVVPGIDAPTSAVNGGERRVTVVYNKKRIQLPVTPTTTPLDLFKSADIILNDSIPVRTAVAMEWFKKVDVKRPLRNYEYVRDVMNSWDYDDQNELIIMDSAIDGIDQEELLSYGVPDKRPEGMSCMMNYSSRPGKWSKRYFVLRPDGQLVTAKSEKARDQENVCHLTDYDIYHVTQSKIVRVKPPKKICFAVKSLQKSNIFADESQYVHFFCTNDRAIADTFWKALQVWRSWHLKYEKGEGLKKSPAAKKVLDSNGPGILPGAPSHNRGESVGSHYQLGAFTSLIDMSDFNKKLDEIEVHKPGEYPDDAPLSKLSGAQAMHARRRSVRVKQPPPASRGLAALATNSAPDDGSHQNSTQSRRSLDEETFAAGGLLGRTYTTRQKAVQDREQRQNAAFTDGPSLISNMDHLAAQGGSGGLNRSSSTRSSTHRRTSSDMRRTASKRIPGMPQPLVDLTPQYRPPPQFAKQGKGFHPGAGAGPLVESATSMDEAIQVPSSTDWRARARPVYAPQPNERTKSLKGRGEPLAAYTFNNHSGAPQDDREAFTGGLLSQAGYAQGNAKVGRGVMDGSKARGPMLDFADERQFQSGSLLANIGGTNAPVIDRSGR